MKITTPQRIEIMKLWGRVCKDRQWKTSDKEFRLAKFSELLGRPLKSTNDVGRIDECTKLMNELRTMLGISIQAAREADDQTINRARVLRNQIAAEIVPCLELYIADVPAYLMSIMEDKNRWWKLDRPAREITILDLDAAPRKGIDKRTGELREFPSTLEQLQYTLSARLNVLRNAAGDTIHEMKTKAQVPCGCAICRDAKNAAAFAAAMAGIDTNLIPPWRIAPPLATGNPF